MRPEHDWANRILAHWPDRRSMGAEYQLVPEELRDTVGRLVRMQSRMFGDYRYFAWCAVIPERRDRRG